jgi:hypothetical protein
MNEQEAQQSSQCWFGHQIRAAENVAREVVRKVEALRRNLLWLLKEGEVKLKALF